MPDIIEISIHASREGSDHYIWLLVQGNVVISIHASREGSDVHEAVRPRRTSQFQSTLPAREATQSSLVTSPFTIFQSTLPAREATQREAKDMEAK